MSAATLTPHQLRHHVAQVHRRDPDARVIGLHVPGDWKGDGALDLDEACFTVVRADTVLEFREALDRAEIEDRPTVLLTRLEQGELGQDVVGRLARARLFAVDPWEGVKGLFKARQLDPSLRDRCLAQALLVHVPGEGFCPTVPAGVLDAGTIWRTLFRFAFGLEDREPDLPALLRWAASGAADARYLAADEDLRAASRRRLEATLGPAAGAILDVVESGHGRDALALAIAYEVVFAEGAADPALQAAAARLERFHRNRPIRPEEGRRLARSARDALDDLALDDPGAAQAQLGRADALLVEVQAAPFAHLGPLTPLGWEGRLRRLACTLDAAIGAPDEAALVACAQAVTEVEAHHQARQRPRQFERTRMALRLLRWLRSPPADEGAFGSLARRYRDEVAFVDWARDALAGGDEVADLAEAYARLEREVAARRGEFNRSFAGALADWTASGSGPGDVLRVEDVLGQVVAPAMAEAERVLLLVLDGMSWAVAHELLADLRRQHWAEAARPGSDGPPPPVISAIPSVTEWSRASLLAGLPHRGRQEDEQRLFRVHAALVTKCERNYPPILFHKSQLTEGGRGALRPEVARAILTPENRVMGVVVNAIDDRLAGAPQVRDAWTIESIRPLGALLQAARESGRVVVLASDHGHVWHREGPATKYLDAGERWRPAQGPPSEGEILLDGPRVGGPPGESRVIVPWDESIHYLGPRNGYHGGATPQEMVAPLVLLVDMVARTRRLVPCASPPPPWWDAPAPRRAHTVPKTRPVAEARPRPAPGYLFPLSPIDSPSEATDETAWLEALLRSPAYKAQKQLARKFVPDDATVRDCLAALARQGGSLTPAALAQALNVLPLRLDGLVAKLQRLLNLDGYEILRLDRPRDLVELDFAKLKRQFELE
ncbi:MAG: BREX-2 system phosphatase PglZ [Acidimicrobiia bacterium]|nr:BREX-2 system phosphatase PglZ [Acidimicrobiia bacterium]